MQPDSILGNFHEPSSDSHPEESIGNMQIFEGGDQVGSIEFFPNVGAGSLDLSVFNTDGDRIADL